MVYAKGSLLENLYTDHKFLRGVAKANLSVDNRIRSTSRKPVEDLLKSNSFTWWYILKTSWRCLENIFPRRLEVLARRFEDVLKTSSRRIEDVWIYSFWSRHFEDVLNTSSEVVQLRRIYSSWSRHLEDVLKTSSKDEDERRLWDVLPIRMLAGAIV